MAERTEHLEAVLLSAARPSQEQEKRFLAFLAEKYGEGTTLTWQKSDDYPGGFRLEVGAEVYDWSAGGRLSQFKDALEKLAATQGDVIPLLKETVLSWTPQAMAQEVGTVLTVGDGIARVDGLEGAAYGEVLLFDGGVRGMVQDLSEDSVGCILFDDDASVCAGSTVRRTGRTAGVPVGEGFLGRVVNALGVPIDGGGDIRADGYRAVESPAPGIIDRQSVDTPLETGILTVDSMFPIGRGQRELIIGDRQTRQDLHRHRHHPEPEGTGHDLHLCGHRSEGVHGRASARHAGEIRRARLQHHRFRHCGGRCAAAVYRAVCRRGDR